MLNIFSKKSWNITKDISDLYYEYFGSKVADQEESWAPHKVCPNCVLKLKQWKSSNGQVQMPWPVPVYWMKVIDHNECLFCQIDLKGKTKKCKDKIVYPKVKSTVIPDG